MLLRKKCIANKPNLKKDKMKLHKTSQLLTLFVIVGILLVFLVLLTLASQKIMGSNGNINADSIALSITRCLSDTSKNAVIELGKHGGKINIELVAFDNLPSVSEMQNELSSYILTNIEPCINNLKTIYSKQGYVITTGTSANPSSMKILIGNDNIDFTLNMATMIKKENEIKTVETFNYNHKGIRLPYLQSIAKEILNDKDNEWIDLTKFSSYDVSIEVIPTEEYIIYSIKDKGFMFNTGESET